MFVLIQKRLKQKFKRKPEASRLDIDKIDIENSDSKYSMHVKSFVLSAYDISSNILKHIPVSLVEIRDDMAAGKSSKMLAAALSSLCEK